MGPKQRSCVKLFRAWVEWFRNLREPEHMSCCRNILHRKAFVGLTSLVIFSHAMFVTMVSDWELRHAGESQPISFAVGEMAFLSFYTIELGLKLEAYRAYFFLHHSAAWNIFDLVLVVFSIADLLWWAVRIQERDRGGNMTFMRVFRLLKIAKILRTIRVIRVFRELSMLLESFKMCFISMFWGLVLLIFLLYIFALVIVHGMCEYLSNGDVDLGSDVVKQVRENFGSVWLTMLSLYMAVTGGNDWSLYFNVVRGAGELYGLSSCSTPSSLYSPYSIYSQAFLWRRR